MEDEDMTDQTTTLGAFFFPVGVEISDESRASLEAKEKLRSLRQELKDAKGDTWLPDASPILDMVGDILDVDLLENVLIKGWNKEGLFEAFLDLQTHPDNKSRAETVTVPILKHTLETTLHPHIEVCLHDRVVKTIDFDVTLTLELEGAELEIRAGRIWKIRTGECTGKGVLKCEGVELASEESRPIVLPGERIFQDGIKIAARLQ